MFFFFSPWVIFHLSITSLSLPPLFLFFLLILLTYLNKNFILFVWRILCLQPAYVCAFPPDCVCLFRAALNMEGSKCARCDGKWPEGKLANRILVVSLSPQTHTHTHTHVAARRPIRSNTKTTVAPSVPVSLPKLRPVLSAYKLSHTHTQTYDISLQTFTAHTNTHTCTDVH